MQTVTKIIDNFEYLAKLLFKEPLQEDEFYFLQILVRGKDGNAVSGNNKNRLVKYYAITSANQLLDFKKEIVALCKADNARAYIHPTKRSFKQVANVALELTTHTYVSQNWIGLRSAWSTAAGKSFITSDKKYIVDLDDVTVKDEKVSKVADKLFQIRGKGGENSNKVFGLVNTKSGVHLITYPFDVEEFKKAFPEIDVHKNNPTLLYFEYVKKFY